MGPMLLELAQVTASNSLLQPQFAIRDAQFARVSDRLFSRERDRP